MKSKIKIYVVLLCLALIACLIGCSKKNSDSGKENSGNSDNGNNVQATKELTEVPTQNITEEPSQNITEEPTQELTEEPSPELTEEPTLEPTEEPTSEPTEEPTQEPIEEPTPEITEEPTPEVTEAPVTYKKYRFRNYKLLDQHYDKHGKEMGFDSRESYEKAASDVINNPEALSKIESEDGDYVYYVESTNEFVVLSQDGYIRTYFYPSAGKKYYDRQ